MILAYIQKCGGTFCDFFLAFTGITYPMWESYLSYVSGDSTKFLPILGCVLLLARLIVIFLDRKK